MERALLAGEQQVHRGKGVEVCMRAHMRVCAWGGV